MTSLIKLCPICRKPKGRPYNHTDCSAKLKKLNDAMTSVAPPPMPQQAFLRDAMQRLGMTRQEFADRLHCSKRRLDTWLQAPLKQNGEPNTEFRELDATIWQFVREILKGESGGSAGE